MLVKDTLRTFVEFLNVARREDTVEHQAQIFHRLVLHGKLRTAVRWITERETGGVLQPGDWCNKTGDWVMEVLRCKHPEAQISAAESLDSYPNQPRS